MGRNNVRKIESFVDIAYGIEEISSAPECASADENKVTDYKSLYNSKHIPRVRAFTLEGGGNGGERADFALSAKRALIYPEVVGWWSQSLSSNEFNAELHGYPFGDPPPKMTVSFASARPVKIFDLFGDPELKEYPTCFRVELINDNGANVYSRVFDNYVTDGRNELACIDRKIELVYDGLDLPLENGYITGVERMSLEILAWNKPRRTSKIYRFYDDIIERYGSDELKSFECIRETANNGEMKYGLVSGSCSVTLLNNKDRKFDLGYLKDLAHINKRVIPYVNNEKLGTYFIKEWDISQTDMFVGCKGNDRLIDFRDIMYEGCMPSESSQTASFGELFKKVLDFANERYVIKFKYVVDEGLFGEYETNPLVHIEPYLPRDSVWAVLQALCEASLSFVYVDKDDRIIVRSELFCRKNGNVVDSIDPDNAFSISIPFYADMETNYVEVPYFRKVVETDKELYKESGVSAKELKTFNRDIEFDDFCEPENIYIDNGFPVYASPTKISDFKYNISFSQVIIEEKGDVSVKGNKIKFEKQSLFAENETSIKQNALSLYTHPDCKLIQSKKLAEEIAARLMKLYPAGTRSATAEWRGNQKLNLLDEYDMTDRFDRKSTYITTYLKNTVDGGFRQEVKGLLLPGPS